jgi:hypothetical protein
MSALLPSRSSPELREGFSEGRRKRKGPWGLHALQCSLHRPRGHQRLVLVAAEALLGTHRVYETPI